MIKANKSPLYEKSPSSIVHMMDVSMRYGKGPEILKNINLSLHPGSFYFLTGESGAGKSSLLRLLFLAQPPSKGDMRLFGHHINQLSRHQLPLLRQRIGIVFQDFRLFPHLTTLENVALPLRLAGDLSQKKLEHVHELLAWVGLLDYAHHYPLSLSGGQQQSAAIARAVIAHPQLLLADEPTGNLDERLTRKLMMLFEELNRNGTTIVIATHNQALIRQAGHPQLAIENGMLKQ